MRSFLYLRQSSGQADPDDSLSIETQEEECKKFAALHGHEVIHVFKEANHSGRLYPEGWEQLAAIDAAYQRWAKDTRKSGMRPKLGEMLRRLDEVDLIICYDITRLHRSLRGSYLENLISQTLISHNVKVMTLKEGEIDFTRFTDSLVTSLTSQINSEQLTIMKEKSKTALRRLKDSGEWSSTMMKTFGYKKGRGRHEIEVDEMRAEIVRKLFKDILSGKSYYMIGKEINPVYYEKTGKALVKSEISRIIRNPAYAGYIRNTKGDLVKAIPLEGKEIIDFGTWKRMQDLLAEEADHPKRAQKSWLPLSGRIRCGYCGTPISCHTLRGRAYYRCLSSKQVALGREGSCRNGIVWDGDLFNDMEGGTFLKDAVIGLLPLYFSHELESSTMRIDEENEKLHIEILNLDKRASTLTEMYAEGLMRADDFKSTMKKMKERKSELQQCLDEMKSIKGGYDRFDLLIDLNELNDKERAELTEPLRWTIKRVTIFRDHVLISTPKGDLELPIREKNGKLLPQHLIAVGDKEIEIIYFFDEFNDEIPRNEIACFGEIKVTMQEW